MKTLCVTGHRPKGFPWDHNSKYEIEHLVYLQKLRETILIFALGGYSHFISGGAIGADLDFAKIVLDIRKDLSVILEIAVPCPNQDLKWNKEDKILYDSIIKKADKVTLVSNSYTSFCMQKRNEYMVNNSDIILAVWNGAESGGTYNTIKYAQKVKKPIKFILLQDIVKVVKESKERNLQALCEKLGSNK